MKRRTTYKSGKAGRSRPAREDDSTYASFPRITFDPKIMDGQACIRGLRIPVSLIVNLVAHGMTPKQIITEYPDLEPEDVEDALQYVAWLSREQVHLAGK